jgi:hypothetical protein
MSMIGCFKRISARDFGRIQADPDLAAVLLTPEEEPEGFDPFTDFDVDKAWHGIHFLLTGSAWEGHPPLNFLVAGGEETGVDTGYGPPRGFSVAEVKEIAKALSSVTVEALRSRYNPQQMQQMEIYPDIWKREGEEGLSYLLGYFEDMKNFVIGGAEQGEALVVFLS